MRLLGEVDGGLEFQRAVMPSLSYGGAESFGGHSVPHVHFQRHTHFMIELNEQQVIDDVMSRLLRNFSDIEPSRVSRVVQEEHARFEGRPIREFVPLFVERHAKEELSKLGAADLPRQETVAKAP